MSMVVYGVDGCKAGWFYVRLDGDAVTHGVVHALSEIVTIAPEHSRVFVDIPIGLQDSAGTRQCDVMARRLLRSPRASSVFSAPIRAVVGESDYLTANATSKRLSGKGLSKQAFAITPKIKEVDDLMRTNSKARSIVREVHPEICFYGFAGGHPMKHKKSRHEGFKERLKVLSGLRPDADIVVAQALTAYLRKDVAKDDILDALVAALTGLSETRTVPESPELDSSALPMEMVYHLAQ
jgi:predicted RNase H-like nuclease